MTIFSRSFSNLSFSSLSFAGVPSLLAVVVALALLGHSAAVVAQTDTSEMSVEQLEAFIKEQQEALEAAISERDRNMQAKKEVEDQLAEQKIKQKEIEEELKTLCEEKAELDPETDASDC